MARATSSLPVPLSPVMSTGTSWAATRPMALYASPIAGQGPTTAPSASRSVAASTATAGNAELVLSLGQEDEYRRTRQGLLGRFDASTDPIVAERASRACLFSNCGVASKRQGHDAR